MLVPIRPAIHWDNTKPYEAQTIEAQGEAELLMSCKEPEVSVPFSEVEGEDNRINYHEWHYPEMGFKMRMTLAYPNPIWHPASGYSVRTSVEAILI
jgi:hypothetical protein